MTKVCIAGATGGVGTELSKAIFEEQNLQLVAGISRSQKGKNLAEILDLGKADIPLFGTVEEALDQIDFEILIEFTHPETAKHNIIAALQKGKKVVVGTSGLSHEDFEAIEKIAIENNTSVLAAGNFALTAVLLFKFAAMAAKYIPNFEIIDYASQSKIDAPSGSVAELAHRLGKIQQPHLEVPIENTKGSKETRGATLDGIQVHAVRLPGHVLGIEAIFGMPDEKLILRHDAGTSAAPYIPGILLAVEKVGTFKGLKRGLDAVMDF